MAISYLDLIPKPSTKPSNQGLFSPGENKIVDTITDTGKKREVLEKECVHPSQDGENEIRKKGSHHDQKNDFPFTDLKDYTREIALPFWNEWNAQQRNRFIGEVSRVMKQTGYNEGNAVAHVLGNMQKEGEIQWKRQKQR